MKILLELEDDDKGGATVTWRDLERFEDVSWYIYPRGTFSRTADGLRGAAGTFASLASDLLDVLRAVRRRDETP